MHDLARLHAFNCVHESIEERTVVFDPVALHVDDDDTESQFLQIDLEFKTLVDRNENVKPSLRLGSDFDVGTRAPFGFGNGQDHVIGEGLSDARIDALV